MTHLNKEIQESLKKFSSPKIIYIYKKYGHDQFVLLDNETQLRDRLENHKNLGDTIVSPMEVFNCKTSEEYKYDDIYKHYNI